MNPVCLSELLDSILVIIVSYLRVIHIVDGNGCKGREDLRQNVKFYMCTPCNGSRFTALVLHLGTRCRRKVNFIPRPLPPRGERTTLTH